MKTLRILMLALLLPAFVMTGCDKGGDDNGDAQIELPNNIEKTQTAFADDETTGGFTFTAKQAWTATVTETGSTRADGAKWLRLLWNGEETYSGAAGKFTLVIELDENYSGETRTATITIKSGNDTITVTVTQDGKTETGVVPTPPDPVQKRISKIVSRRRAPYVGGSDSFISEFSYDNQGRVVEIIATKEGNSSSDNYDRTCKFVWTSNKITINTETEYEDDLPRSEWVILDGNNLATEYWSDYWDYDNNYETTEKWTDIEYKNGAMSKVTDSYQGAVENVYIPSWDASGNIAEMDVLDGKGALDWEVAITYTSHPNNLNFDLNWMVGEMYVGGLSTEFLATTGVFGKRCTNLIETYREYWVEEDGSEGDFRITFDYEFDEDGYVTKVTEDWGGGDSDQDATIFEIYYE